MPKIFGARRARLVEDRPLKCEAFSDAAGEAAVDIGTVFMVARKGLCL